MGRVERERQQLKALGLYQALQYPGASGYLGRPQMPMMYPPPVLPNFPLQYPAQAQYPPQQQFYQPQYPGMAEQYNPYIPQTYAQPLFPQQFQQNPYQQYHPSQFSTAPDVYRNRQSLNSVSTESSDSVARRETLKEKFLAEERAKEMERKKERLDGGVYESRSFSFSTGTGSKAKEESGTESEDDIPIKTKPVSNESIFTKLLSKKKNDLVEEEDEVPLGKMKGIKKIVVPEPDSDDDMPLAALGLSRPAAKSIDSDDEPIGLKK